jgi:type I restriction enzyme S subunit
MAVFIAAPGHTVEQKIEALKQIQGETAAELDEMLPSILDKAFKGEL